MRVLAAPAGWRLRFTRGHLRFWPVVGLCLILPFFGQTFHYIKVIMPLWALSKAWPIITLPLALRLFAGPRPEGSRQVVLTFVWLLLVPSFISQTTFNQNVIAALPAQVKLLPILYFFSFLALLRWADPAPAELERAVVVLALASFAILLVIWALAPQSAYVAHYDAGDAPCWHRTRGGIVSACRCSTGCWGCSMRSGGLRRHGTGAGWWSGRWALA
jgi:hypothetical protein